MPIDASIYNAIQPFKIESPVNQLAQIMQIQGAQQANALNGMKMSQVQQELSDQNALRSLFGQSGFDMNKPEWQQRVMATSPTLGQGLLKSQAELVKARTESDAKTLDLATKRHGIWQQAVGSLYNDPTLTKDTVLSVGQQLVQAGIIPSEMFTQSTANLPDDPTALRSVLKQGVTAQLSPEKIVELFTPKPEKMDNGQTLSFVDNNPNSPTFGKPVGGMVQRTTTPDARLAADTAAQSRSLQRELANQGVSYQQDASGNIIALPSKPVAGQPVVGSPVVDNVGKPIQGSGGTLNDSQSKALLFGSRMQQSDKILGDLSAKGVDTSNIGSRAGYGVGGVVNALQSQDQQSLDQAKRDFINAVLRRESGAAISPSEFDSAEKQYFPQIGDRTQVILQKANNRKLAIQGMLSEVPEAKRKLPGAPTPGLPTADAIAAELARRNGGK